MRTLIYVPIIHTSADLGSLAEEVTKRGISDLGSEIWSKHEETVLSFWDVIIKYFDSIEVSGFKLYQDGMPAEGEVGQRIVDEVVKSGSKNYEVIANLIHRGAILVRTEDVDLVKKEHNMLLRITRAKTLVNKFTGLIRYKLAKDNLLNKRDEFIAERIEETLNEGETGVIFIGAYHNIRQRLPKDFQIREIKDINKVREYHKLLRFYHKHRKQIEELSRYLISEIPKGG
ncbi:MAG: hypothetical protein AABY66_06815 [Nitrospirota bacterium]